MSGEIIQALSELICKPSVKVAVKIKAIKVVTRAIPPLNAGAYLMASFRTSGARTNCAPVKNSTLAIRPTKLRLKSGTNNEAMISPRALPITDKAILAKKRSTARYSLSFSVTVFKTRPPDTLTRAFRKIP